MKKIGLFLAIGIIFLGMGIFTLTASLSQAQNLTPQVLVQEERPEVKFETLKSLLGDLKLVERKTFDDKIVYDVRFRSFSSWHVDKIIIKAVPTGIKTRYVAYHFETAKTVEFLRFEVNLIESYKTFIFDSKKTYETTDDGIRTTKETEKSVDIHITLRVEDSSSLNNEEVAEMIGKMNRAIKENRPLTFICSSVTLYPFYFDKFDPLSKIEVFLYVKEIKED